MAQFHVTNVTGTNARNIIISSWCEFQIIVEFVTGDLILIHFTDIDLIWEHTISADQ